LEVRVDLKYPKWQEPLATAILEFDPQQLSAKLQSAEEAIFNRIGELAFEKDAKEGRLLSDGLSVIRSLKEHRLRQSRLPASS
jgi:hypothetical protein